MVGTISHELLSESDASSHRFLIVSMCLCAIVARRHCAPFISLCRCRVECKSGRIRPVKHSIVTLATLAVLFASLVVSAPILCATDLRGGVVGRAGPRAGVGVALFEVKPNKTLRRVRETVTAPDGKYYFNKVHPGRYVLRIGGIDYPLEVGETQMQDIPVIAPPRH
jgi:hypothetical protein